MAQTLHDLAKSYLAEQMNEDTFGCSGGIDAIIEAYEDGYTRAATDIVKWLKENCDNQSLFITYNDGSAELSEEFFSCLDKIILKYN